MPSTISDADHTLTCPSCGRNPVAAGPAGPGAPPVLVRRVVAVLFVDIVGFTALVDGLEPEEVRALQVDYFGAVSRVARAYGGIVEKYVGDAVLVVFGSDEQDDALDAYRAVQAGLRMQEDLDGRPLAGRHPVRTRVGIATGDVVAELGARDGGHAMISGSVVTTAARLQAYAPHGTVVVDAYTRHATAAMIAYQDLPPVAAPGKPRPLELWRALPRHNPRHAARPRTARLTAR
ncbi:adenylate/guanylate cyclase domain-containing protein [Spirilliplanes yamanashiensis]|uniref:Guanylate cyclase domain-containing protein n=1 Tax=Spirilliplanes yamanashiensis TaxID=42233 RepID=A0A8J4DKW4_9ACTN|nr:adenylate/guanylate cyclase domain-containing protein [Spirilliplanes yamanashiensis]MDP9818897.1 class 3 adenylate cyclase [Spirilliplanes yamanashiensis]GIJ05351.1 hypothetical protein Sya03_47030 [Spirilliplanes yamanashiensis]